MGLGYYNLMLSGPLKAQFPGLRDEQGVELFYNARIVPGCHLSPDFQIVHPGLAPVQTALVLGLRLKVDFKHLSEFSLVAGHYCTIPVRSFISWEGRNRLSALRIAPAEPHHGRPLPLLLPEFRVPRARQAGGRKPDCDQSLRPRHGSDACSAAGPARPASPNGRGRHCSTPGSRPRRSNRSWSISPRGAASARPGGSAR